MGVLFDCGIELVEGTVHVAGSEEGIGRVEEVLHGEGGVCRGGVRGDSEGGVEQGGRKGKLSQGEFHCERGKLLML